MFDLIMKREWEKIRSLLKTPEASELCKMRDETGLTCLSSAMGFNAPIDVVRDILKIDPSLARVKDTFESTVLHVACLNGASIDCIELFVSQYPDLVIELDCDKRCPLHHAVEFASLSGNKSYHYLDVIQLLSSKAPEMIYFADKNGDTPTDIVQIVKQDVSETSSKYDQLQFIYYVLRQRGIELYKDRKKVWESEGYKGRDLLDCKETVSSTSSSCSETSNNTDTKSVDKSRSYHDII
jgi:hypothetical protein